jgi:hypothetical protein
LFWFVILALAWPASAQELTGRIEGTVTDPQGAVIPGASVTATHVDTNTEYKTSTSAVGHFVVPNARLGRYRITVESAGFRRAVITGAVVEIGAVADVNVKLELGEITEEITVAADITQEIVNTVDAQLGTTVDNRQVLELPLNGRNAAELVFLQAGTYYETDPDGQGDKLFIHGQRHRSINFSLDGIDTQDNLNRASSVMVNGGLLAMTAENVQEFRVATGVSSAEFGRGGSQVTAVTRAGSNNWHGSLFWFHRNTVFDANDFFNNVAGQERPPLLRHQFGGRVGGPIWRDRAFFFFGYQQTREKRGIPVHRVVWSDMARQGIYQWCDATVTTSCVLRSADLFTIVPTATIDPFINNNILANMPRSNVAGGDGLNTLGYRFNSEVLTYEHLPSFRFDYKLSNKHQFYGTWNYTDRNIVGDFINGREPIWDTLGPLGDRVTHTNSFGGALNSAFTPTMVNEFRVGRVGGENAFTRHQPFGVPFVLDFDDITDPYSIDGGHGGSFRDNVTLHIRDSFTWVKGRHQFKFGGEWRHRSVENFSFAEADPLGEIDFNDSDAPPFGGTTASQTALCTAAGLSGSTCISSTDRDNAEELFNNLTGVIGQIEARYTVNNINSTTYEPIGTPERRLFYNREVDFFFQDNWNIHPRLSLNLGMRWEWAGVPDERHGLILLPQGGADGIFGVSGPAGFGRPGIFTGGFPCPNLLIPIASPTGADLDSLFDTCAVPNVPAGSKNGLPLYDNDFNNFGPVLGVAWDPFGTGKTSIRAGYRLSYAQDVFSIIDGNVDDNAGLILNHDCAPQDGDCGNTAVFMLSDIVDGNGNVILAGASPVRTPPTTFSLPVTTHVSNTGDDVLDLRAFATNLGTEHYHEWSLSLQREFLRNWAAEIRYVGTRGRDLRRVADFNEFNLFAEWTDPVGGQTYTFLDAFLLAQTNLAACNAANAMTPGSCTTTFGFNAAIPGSVPNPFMSLLLRSEPSTGNPANFRFLGDGTLVNAIAQNAPGSFLHRYLADLTSRPRSGAPTSQRRNGGAFFGLVLQGELPLNFFNVNPFLGSARQLVGDGFSNYNALEIEIRRRPVGGFAFQANYTYQKGITDFDGDANELLNDTRPSSIRNPRYTSQEYVPHHQFSANWIYELPVGQGKAWDPQNGFGRGVLGGWQFGGIINWRSGRPLSITSGIGTFHRGGVSDENTVNLAQSLSVSQLRNLTGQLNITTIDNNTGLSLPGIFWFDPCLSSQVNGFLTGGACTADPNAIQGLFQLPNPGELGQLPNSVIFGPRRFLFDFNLSKRTRITESTEFEFRWEVFNAFNNVNFQNPVTNIFDNDFGRIFRTVTRPREMQFALKFNF